MRRFNFLTKGTTARRWIPIAFCCIPRIVVVIAVGFALFANLRISVAGANPIFLLLILACPVGMGLMMWLMAKDMNKQPRVSKSEGQAETELDDKLVTLYVQRELLEAEIAVLEAQAGDALTDEVLLAPEDERLIAPETR